jgi:hypothetical protein
LKLSVTGSGTVQFDGFKKFKSGVVEQLRRRYILKIVTTEGVPKLEKEFRNSLSTVKVDGHHPNSSTFLPSAFVLRMTDVASSSYHPVATVVVKTLSS